MSADQITEIEKGTAAKIFGNSPNIIGNELIFAAARCSMVTDWINLDAQLSVASTQQNCMVYGEHLTDLAKSYPSHLCKLQ